ncbi:MAG: SGNH/GDSL hydrolase family protein [Desulfomonilaceae bacterium]
MKQLFRFIGKVVKCLIVAVICVEVLSFLAITASNYILYGRAREGGRAVYDPYTLFLQKEGVRPTANNSRSKDKGKNKVLWLLGGSTMRGATPRDDTTIPSFLSGFLNSNQQDLHFTVINFGVDSFNSLLETKYLQKLLIESSERPDFIIFYDGANDAKYFLEHRDPYAHHGYRRVRALIESYYRRWLGLLKPLNAAIYASFTKELYDKIHQVWIPLDPNSPALKKLVVGVEQRYDHVNKIAHCYGAEFRVIWQPIVWVEDCQVSAEIHDSEKDFFVDTEKLATMRRNFVIPYLACVKRLNRKPYFVDFRKVLCGRKEAAYQPDGVHLTDAGRKMVAEQMYRLLNGLILK